MVVDASVAIKWVVEERDSEQAVSLFQARLYAPDLLIAECANVLWKKVRRGELTIAEASVAAMVLETADVEFVPMRHLIKRAVEIAVAMAHPAYDCLYLALADTMGCEFVTSDDRLHAKARLQGYAARVVRLADAAGPPDLRPTTP